MKLTLKRCLSALICFILLTGGIPAFTEETVTPAPEVVQATAVPTETPTEAPTETPTEAPTEAPTEIPTEAPTEIPTEVPTEAPTDAPTEVPTEAPTEVPAETPAATEEATEEPSASPSPEATLSPEEMLAAEVAIWVAEVSGKADDYEKALHLYKKLIASAVPGEGSAAADAIIVLSADDMGYALALEMLLDAAGIDCRTVDGKTAWNIAEIDGEWTHIDAYADDKSGVTGRHFGLSDAAMLRDHEWSTAAYPAAAGSKNNYYVREKDYLAFDSADTLRAILSDAVETETPALCLYNAGSELSVAEAASAIITEIAPEVALSVNENGFLAEVSLAHPSGIMMAAPLILPTDIIAESETLTLGLYEKYSISDFWKFVPENASDGVSYSSSATRYVSVSADGMLTANRKGSATITITAASGVSCKVKVTVKYAPTSVKGTASRYTIGVDESMQLGYTLSSGCAGHVCFSSANPSVATITESGLIQGISPGTAKITIETYNGKKASGTFTVVAEPAEVILSRESVSIGAKDSWKLDAALNPGAVGNIWFSSSDETIATVDESGRISALAEGTCTITASTYNGVSKPCSVTVVPEPTDVILTAPYTTIGVGEKLQLEASMLPGEALGTMKFSSSNTRYATVSSTGVVTGRRAGSAVITAASYNGVTETIKVTVKYAPRSITGVIDRKVLGVGESMQVGYKLNSGAAGQVAFSVSDESIATIAQDGTLTAVAPGNVSITIKAYNGVKKSTTITVKEAPSDIILSRESVSIGAKDSWVLGAQLNEGAGGEIKFSSSDETIATVDESGRISALAEGTCTITASTYNGVSKPCSVTVVPEPTDVILTAPYTTIGVGEKLQLEASMLPGEALGTMKFSSSNTRYATVSSTGVVTGRRAGSAVITATSYNGVTETIKVTVKYAPRSITGVIDRKVLGVGESMQVGYKLNSGAAGQVAFSTADESIATIAQDGTLTAVAPGNVSVTIKAFNGVKKSTTITVKEAPSDIILARDIVSIGAKDSWVLGAQLNEGAGGEIKFSSSDETIATVDENGRISALTEGTCTITASTYNGVSKPCAVTVVPEPTDVILTAPYTTIGVGEKLQLEASMLPGEALGTMKFSSSNTRYATVSSTGVVTGRRAGSAVITAASYNGVTETIKVTVKYAPRSITGVIDRKVLGVGESMQVGYKLNSGAAGQVAFSTADESIATIAQDGTLTAVTPGNVSVTIKAFNGVKKSTTITVKEAPSDIILARDIVSIGAKDSWVLGAQLNEGAGSEIKFSSSDETIATVDENGRISALTEGTCTITASTYNGVSKPCAVTVVPEPTDVILTAPYTTIGVGEKLQLEASMLPGEALGTVKFSGSNTRYATVSSTGVVTGRRAGSAVITATSYNGVTETIKITVKYAPRSITGVIDRKVLGVGESMQVGYKLNSGAAGQVAFSVSDESIATIAQDGTLTAVTPGNVSVTVKAYNGVKRSTTITIKEAPSDIILARDIVSIGAKDSWVLGAQLNEGAGGEIKFSSSDETIATVDESGRISALAEGTCTITASTYNGVSKPCAVTVVPEPTDVILTAPYTTIGVGEKLQLEASMLPGEALGTMKFSSSNTRYATVSSTGVVTGRRAGSAVITAASYNGVTETIKVTVKAAPRSITGVIDRKVLGVGESMQVGYKLNSGAAGQVAFSVSDESIATIAQDGTLTAVAPGNVSVTVKAYNGVKKSTTITVKEAPTAIAFDMAEPVVLGASEERQFSASLNEGSAGAIRYYSDNPEIAVIDEVSGYLIAVAPGTAHLRAVTYVPGLEAEFNLEVRPAPQSLTMMDNPMYIAIGETVQLDPIIDDGAQTSFRYSSSNTKYTKVSSAGEVRSSRAGTYYITIRTHNDLSYKLKLIVRSAPKSISLKPALMDMGVGQKYRLSGVMPSGTASSLTWESLTPDIVSVDKYGVVTALQCGEGSVKVSTFNGHSSTNDILVHEAPATMSLSAPAVLGVGLQGSTVLTLGPEGSYTLPEYSVVSGDAVTIDETGVITAVAPGEAVIRAASHVEGLYADAAVTVLPAPTYISFADAEYIVYLGETLQLEPETDEGSFTRLSYKPSSESYFTVDENGLVTPLRHGSATITVKTHNGLSAKVSVRVIDPNFPEAISLASNPPEYLELNEVFNPEIVVFPATAIPDIKWTSSSPDIAAVDETTGKVTAKSYGRATITGVSDRNPTLSISYKIIVLSPVRCLKIPTRRTTSTTAISGTLSMIKNVRASAYLELETLYLQGKISKSDYTARKGYIERAFDMHLMPWMTETKQLYWKAANSENGAKDYKPGIVYYGLPYTQTNRVNNRTSAVAAGYYTDTGKGYYLMNGSKFTSRNYPGNDCSSFCSMAVWGMDSSRRRDNTRTIASASYYTTLTDWKDLRPGDLLNKGGSHVVMFLYYTNAAKTQFMIIEQGGGEAGTNTISCSIRDVSYYTSKSYKIRRVGTLGM